METSEEIFGGIKEKMSFELLQEIGELSLAIITEVIVKSSRIEGCSDEEIVDKVRLGSDILLKKLEYLAEILALELLGVRRLKS